MENESNLTVDGDGEKAKRQDLKGMGKGETSRLVTAAPISDEQALEWQSAEANSRHMSELMETEIARLRAENEALRAQLHTLESDKEFVNAINKAVLDVNANLHIHADNEAGARLELTAAEARANEARADALNDAYDAIYVLNAPRELLNAIESLRAPAPAAGTGNAGDETGGEE